ncbi:hypothetical protein ACYCMM_25125, partial [Klebsiella pneumoniae]
NTYDLFVGKTILHGDVLMWLMKTLLTSRCINQRGAGHATRYAAGILKKPAVVKWMDRTTGCLFLLFAAKLAMSRR